jgi:hypothetical protein
MCHTSDMAGLDLHDFETIHILSWIVMLMQTSKENWRVYEAAENRSKIKNYRAEFPNKF